MVDASVRPRLITRPADAQGSSVEHAWHHLQDTAAVGHRLCATNSYRYPMQAGIQNKRAIWSLASWWILLSAGYVSRFAQISRVPLEVSLLPIVRPSCIVRGTTAGCGTIRLPLRYSRPSGGIPIALEPIELRELEAHVTPLHKSSIAQQVCPCCSRDCASVQSRLASGSCNAARTCGCLFRLVNERSRSRPTAGTRRYCFDRSSYSERKQKRLSIDWHEYCRLVNSRSTSASFCSNSSIFCLASACSCTNFALAATEAGLGGRLAATLK